MIIVVVVVVVAMCSAMSKCSLHHSLVLRYVDPTFVHAVSACYWASGLTVCMRFQVASALVDMLIPQSGMINYYWFAWT